MPSSGRAIILSRAVFMDFPQSVLWSFCWVAVAEDVVDTLFQALIGSLAFILVIKFGVGGIWAASDRFWPNVYDKFSSATADTSVE